MEFSKYTNKTFQQTLEDFGSSGFGLSKKESAVRLQKYSLNSFKAKDVSAINILIRQFKSPFFYLLFIAVLVSIIIGQGIESITFSVFIALNVIIGFFQEYRAEKSVALLKKFIPQKTRVLRPSPLDKKNDSKEEIIDKQYLVPGDVVLLEAGDIVPADLRIVNLYNFLVDESSITGESIVLEKTEAALSDQQDEAFNAKNILFSGTSVVSGKAIGVVIATGVNTVFGKIIKRVSKAKKQSVYKKSILYFCKLIIRIVATTIILIFIANLLLKGLSNFSDFLFFSIALIISILPEALPAVITFALSVGSLKMAKHDVVVTKLSAVEDLGNIEVLCTDKTGTLTQNKLSLEKIVSSNKDRCFLYGVLGFKANKVKQKILNPFDAALHSRASQEIIRKVKNFQIISELPFDSYRMKSSFLVQSGSHKFLVTRGAVESVLKACSKFNGKFTKKEIKEDAAQAGNQGKRVLAIAFKKISSHVSKIETKDEKHLTFLGYFVFEDPLKNTAKEAIELSKKLGIQIKIITGDSKETAGYVAQKTGVAVGPSDLVSGHELELMTKEDFDFTCQEKTVFARISPDLKYKIIESLQKKCEVGFLGDGINDAPALKISNVGIAVAESSDVSKEAADVVLLQKDLRVIVNGIKNGRTIFSNINKYIKCTLASNFGNFYSIAVISLFINFLPMLPVQILLANILSDFPLISIATDSVDVAELRRPKLYQIHLVLPLIISLALVSTVFDFVFFSIFYKQSPAIIQSLWFIESVLTEIALIYIIRTKGLFYKAKKPKFLLVFFTIVGAIFVVLLPYLKIGQNWFGFVALPILPLITVLFLISIYFVVSEIVKLIYFHYWTPERHQVKP